VAFPLRVEVGEILPQGADEHDTLQLTPLLLESLPTIAMMLGTLPVASTVAVVGVMEIVTEGIVIVAVADLVASSKEVAVTVTVRSLAGGLVGGL